MVGTEAFSLFSSQKLFLLILHMLLIPIHELIYTTGSIHQLHLPRIERVRSAGDFQLVERILNPLNGNRLAGIDRGLNQKHLVIGHVLKGYHPVVLRVQTLFHGYLSSC